MTINIVVNANTMKFIRILPCIVMYYRSELQQGKSLVNIMKNDDCVNKI